MYNTLFKRALDVFVAFLGLLILSPILIIVTIALSFANKGTPFFFQRRPGKGEVVFKVIKFKTMNDKKDEAGNLAPDSVRLTKIGRLLRRLSLDEIPQLINVLKGDMSLIGPRPLLERYLPFYTEKERLRHSIRPGITGWAQVNGRNNLTWDNRLAADIYYVENMSFFLDLKIIFRTIKNIIGSKDIVTLPSDTMRDLDIERKQQKTPSIKQLLTLNLREAEELRTLLVDSYPVIMQPFVIYSDKNYASYLTRAVSDLSSHRFYVIRIGSEIAGLIHFKMCERDLFLNNIFIKSSYHGLGFGKTLFNHATEDLLQSACFTSISLDVFGNNQKARGWYLKMGFADTGKSFWYDLSHLLAGSKSPMLKVATDSNGFSGLYYGSKKVASIINNNVLVFRGGDATVYLEHIDRFLYKNAVLISSDELEYPRLATSYRMTLKLNKGLSEA